MADESLCRLDALELSRVLHRREASCRDLMAASLARVGRLNQHFNAIVSLRGEAELLDEAQRCDAELALLRIARAYELATQWVQRRPPTVTLTGDPT